MAYRSSGLPSRFPVGTKFVIEGCSRGGGEVQVSRRYLEFPDGTLIRLPAQPLRKKAQKTRSRRTRWSLRSRPH